MSAATLLPGPDHARRLGRGLWLAIGAGVVLNLGKVTQASWDYYLNQVAGSQEEYYTGAGEAPGRILPTTLAARLGLTGVADPDRFRRLLAGLHPDTGERLRHRTVKVLAFDIAFRPAKGVCLLWALGGPHIAA